MHAHNTTAVGRRKTSVARVILAPGSGKIIVNKKPLEQFFALETLRTSIVKPFEVTQSSGKYDVHINVDG